MNADLFPRDTRARDCVCEISCKPAPHGQDPQAETNASAKISSLARWGKFNLVGAIGISVQFAALFVLKSVVHIHYLVATAIAVEIAVLHNFVWHERFTWADRIRPRRTQGTQDFIRTDLTDLGGKRTRFLVLWRLWRFHLANGTVSILGNLAVMKALVGFGHMNYLVVNAIGITACSLLNFIVSDQWVFESSRVGD